MQRLIPSWITAPNRTQTTLGLALARSTFTVLAAALLLLALCSSQQTQTMARCALNDSNNTQENVVADVVVLDADIYTMNRVQPRAQAIAISGDRILAVGSNEEISKLRGPKTVTYSAGGKLLTPGLIEGHGHFLGLGQSLQMLDLAGADSWNEIVQQVKQAADQKLPGQWIVGRGWHQEKWSTKPSPNVEGYPIHDALSAVSPQNPVLLTHASGHMSFANDYAMKLANVTGQTNNPPGGEILMLPSNDGSGNVRPTGVFRETAASLVQAAYNRSLIQQTDQQKRQQWQDVIDKATANCLKNGITSFQDAGSTIATIDRFHQLASDKKLDLRMWVMVRDSNLMMDQNLKRVRTIDHGGNFLTVRAIKRAIDGALGAHGAWLLQPYADLPSSSGLNTATIESIEETAQLAIRDDFQLCVHAIGDRANQEVLNLYARIWQQHLDDAANGSVTSSDTSDLDELGKSLRWRIEHAQHLDPADIPRFAQMGVIPAMQAIHCPSDAVYVMQRLGDRRAGEGAYMWRSLIDSGSIIANGTDAPVERIDPIASLHASVSRKLKDGRVFFGDQAMTRDEALRSYTLWAAYAAFEEKSKGSLEPGKLADIVIFSQDFMTCPEDKIQQTKVLTTIVGGNIKFQNENGGLTKLED